MILNAVFSAFLAGAATVLTVMHIQKGRTGLAAIMAGAVVINLGAALWCVV